MTGPKFVDVRDADLGGVRGRIGLVSQDPVIFGANVWDNIRYGRPDADDADVRHASEAAAAAGGRGEAEAGGIYGERRRVQAAAGIHNVREGAIGKRNRGRGVRHILAGVHTELTGEGARRRAGGAALAAGEADEEDRRVVHAARRAGSCSVSNFFRAATSGACSLSKTAFALRYALASTGRSISLRTGVVKAESRR